MTAAELPGWLRYRIGARPIILVAPHGGERSRRIRRGDGMNDLYTADLCHELARRLDAYAVVNEGLDRNDVDLNRISAVVDRAPELLRVLCDAVTRAGADGTVTPLVLFVHGWNISSLACDIGIGLRESGGALHGAHATVSAATLRGFVEPLRDALTEHGLEGFIGHRYPASGRDNATQLFSGRHVGHGHGDVDYLSRMGRAGRADAVQLELSIPLRWPGEYRSRWLAAMESAVDEYLAAVSSRDGALGDGGVTEARRWASSVVSPRLSAEREGAAAPPQSRGESVQAVLADGGGLFMGVEVAGPAALAARVCIARPGGDLALFVCEAPWQGSPEHFVAGGLDWRSGTSVRYAGPAVLYDTHDAFVDLEGGLRSARVVDVEVAVPILGSRGTRVDTDAYVRVGDEVVEVAPLLVRRAGGRFAGERGMRARVVLAAPGGATLAIEDREGAATAAVPAEASGRMAGSIAFAPDGGRLRVRSDGLGAEIHAVVTVRVPVYRPAPGGGFVKITFGVAELTGEHGYGRHALFETVATAHPNA